MNPALLSLLAEAEVAQIKLEKSRHSEEAAKTAVEAAKAALEGSRAETASALSARDDVISKAETAGLQRKQFRTLVEDRVTALHNSGLFNMSEVVLSTPVVVKPRVVKRREVEPTLVTTGPVSIATSVLSTLETLDVVNNETDPLPHADELEGDWASQIRTKLKMPHADELEVSSEEADSSTDDEHKAPADTAPESDGHDYREVEEVEVEGHDNPTPVSAPVSHDEPVKVQSPSPPRPSFLRK